MNFRSRQKLIGVAGFYKPAGNSPSRGEDHFTAHHPFDGLFFLNEENLGKWLAVGFRCCDAGASLVKLKNELPPMQH
jgi:hypothetical protein